jgi:hypothetical protein
MKLKNQRIVICGSMSFYADMVTYARTLRKEGIEIVIPESDDPFIETFSEEAFQEVKLNASMRHIRKIRDHVKTFGILVLNRDKHGIANYIGPNTFAEIAIALAHYKKIYLFQDMPKFYRDELSTWGVICLNGDLSRIINDYKKSEFQRSLVTQLDLFTD